MSRKKPTVRAIGCFAFITQITAERGFEILFVLQKEPRGNRYALPGGGPKRNESFYQAVHREVLEETQLTITTPKKPIAHLKRIDRFAKMVIFEATDFDGEARSFEGCKEIIHCKWMTIGEIVKKRKLFKSHHFFSVFEILGARLSEQAPRINGTVKKKPAKKKRQRVLKALDQK